MKRKRGRGSAPQNTTICERAASPTPRYTESARWGDELRFDIMRLAVVASALILITASGWSSALAQGGPAREAPVGHRQPKAGNVPQEQQLLSDPDKKLLSDPDKKLLSDPDKKMKELDDTLARKLQGICRGC